MSAMGSTAGPPCIGSIAARLYRLALEKERDLPEPVTTRSQNEGVPLREIAEAIGRGLKVPVVSKSPEEAGEHFGWLAHLRR